MTYSMEQIQELFDRATDLNIEFNRKVGRNTADTTASVLAAMLLTFRETPVPPGYGAAAAEEYAHLFLSQMPKLGWTHDGS